MADELIIPVQWVEIYTETGIVAGTPLLITCRGKHSIFLVEKETQPAENTAGIELYSTRQAIIDAGALGLWARVSKGVDSLAIIQEDI